MVSNRFRFTLVFSALLYLLSFIADQFSPGKYSVKGIITRISNNIRRDNKDFHVYTESNDFKTLFDENLTESVRHKFLSKHYYIFIYKKGTTAPILWNTQFVQPDNNILNTSKNNYLIKLLNGWYIVEKKAMVVNQKQLIAVALIPIETEYYINNNYLNNTFISLPGVEKRFYVSVQPTANVIKDESNNSLFYLGQKNSASSSFNNSVSIFLRLLALFMLFYVINQFCASLIIKKGIFYATACLIIILFSIRLISYFLPFPFNFYQFELFNPAIYTSGPILRSLGDLLINTFLVVWVVFFMKDRILKMKNQWPADVTRRIFYTILICLLMMDFTMLAGYIVNTLVRYSQISFDVLNFFSMNNYSVIGFIILCGVSTGYFFMMQLLLHFIKPELKNNFYLPLLIIAVASLILLSLFTGKDYFVFYFLLMCWMILFLFLLNYDNLAVFKYRIISSNVIFWIFFFSLSNTLILVYENNRKELESRKHYIQNIADKTDPAGERMMSITLADLKNDYLALQFYRLRSKQDNYFLKDSLLHENFPGYLNRYETRIYTFDSTGTPLYNPDSTSLNALNVIVESQSKQTSVPGLSYYDVSFERFNYITRKIVKRADGNLMGYLFIISSPKRYKSDALYPQLFNKGNTDAIENSPLYSYAIYVNKYLINSNNDYPFPTSLPKEINFYTNYFERSVNGYSELWYKVNPAKLVVITKPDNGNIEIITLFAYLFCSFLAGITLLNLFVLLIKSRFRLSEVFSNIQLTVRNQVHGTIILIILISFIIIAITTILFFINRYTKNDHEKLSRVINVIENDIINSGDSTFTFHSDDKNAKLVKDNTQLASTVNKIAEVHGSDINIYDLDGQLQVSSLPLPYNKGILSNLMDPEAYFHLHKLKDAQYFAMQKIGDLEYLNDYIPLRDKNGKEYGYLNIPDFESQNKLYEEISNFLVTIINLNAFIFLIAGIVAFFITNRITNSFFFISEKMRAINLGKTNELIKWTRKDEIGDLVKEYNRMVSKLEESAAELARSEREGAWREMARQVAHEIKNPLTPMKLNLQYLQMAIDNKSPKVADISLYVSKILVEQIDHLSQIATDFSQFADINHSHNQKFDLNEILKKLHLLYTANNNIKVTLEIDTEPSFVYADKTQIQRVFTNLIQNAVQSIPENKEPHIIITSQINDNRVITTVKDNGTGIPVEMRDKIFTPNFTTKSSGTGLGLAMSRGIVEKIDGKIWFETSESDGTTFYVDLPIEV